MKIELEGILATIPFPILGIACYLNFSVNQLLTGIWWFLVIFGTYSVVIGMLALALCVIVARQKRMRRRK